VFLVVKIKQDFLNTVFMELREKFENQNQNQHLKVLHEGLYSIAKINFNYFSGSCSSCRLFFRMDFYEGNRRIY
jgi:hypothetical protein